MTLTREQAEAAGWRFAFYGEEVALCRAMNHPLAVEAETPGQALKAVTAIESYPSAVALLEECKRRLRAVQSVVVESERDEEITVGCHCTSVEGDCIWCQCAKTLAKLEAL